MIIRWTCILCIQDDEYLASLQADREKEMKAREEDEIRRKEEQAAREAALEEERLKEEELRRKLEEKQVMLLGTSSSLAVAKIQLRYKFYSLMCSIR